MLSQGASRPIELGIVVIILYLPSRTIFFSFRVSFNSISLIYYRIKQRSIYTPSSKV